MAGSLLVGTEVFWANEQDRLLTLLYPEIQEAVNQGVLVGGEAIAAVELGVDFTVINELAVSFAQQYSFELVTQINGQTVRVLQSFVSDWISSGQPLHELTKAIVKDKGAMAMFGAPRAKLVAITETTRAFGEGNMLMWKRAGYVEGTTWHTVRDNDVDTLCLENERAGVVKLGEAYPSGQETPPAHPGCRCYLSPYTGRKLWLSVLPERLRLLGSTV